MPTCHHGVPGLTLWPPDPAMPLRSIPIRPIVSRVLSRLVQFYGGLPHSGRQTRRDFLPRLIRGCPIAPMYEPIRSKRFKSRLQVKDFNEKPLPRRRWGLRVRAVTIRPAKGARGGGCVSFSGLIGRLRDRVFVMADGGGRQLRGSRAGAHRSSAGSGHACHGSAGSRRTRPSGRRAASLR